MNLTRRELVKGSLAALGFLAHPALSRFALASGNHDIEGWWYMDFGSGIFPDKNVRAKYILGADTAAKWEEIWGEKYEPVWHRVVNGYHFVGQHWGEESADNPKKSYYSEMEMVKFLDEHSGEPWMASGAKPFFVVRHVAPQRGLCAVLRKYPNAITLYGHAHGSAARWNMVRLYGGNAVIEMPACDSRGDKLGLAGTPPIAKVKPEGSTAAGYPRSAYVLRVYDDMLVVERREFGAHGGSLGPNTMRPARDGWVSFTSHILAGIYAADGNVNRLFMSVMSHFNRRIA